MRRLLLICILPLLLTACAHHRDVRPGADGIHIVRITAEESDEGAQDAIAQAQHYCSEKKKEAVFLNENKQYTGHMDEKTYKNLKTASRVAQTAGGAAYVFGGKTESQLGGLVGLGGAVADSAAGKGYSVEMKFKCH